MKKLISLLLLVTLFLSLSACGNDNSVIDNDNSGFCTECGKEILSNDKFCGNCGTAVIKKNNNATENQSSETKEDIEDNETNISSVDITGEIGKTYTLNDIEFTVTHIKVEDTYNNQYNNNDGNGMVAIWFTAKNISKQDVCINDIGIVDYDNGYLYSEGSLITWKYINGVRTWVSNGELTIEKLDDTVYEVGAFIDIPKKVVESEKSLTYTLMGYKFKIR